MKKRPPDQGPVRCAIYTRKSSEEGLEQDFNSLDAQRAAAEAYIQSRAEDRADAAILRKQRVAAVAEQIQVELSLADLLPC